MLRQTSEVSSPQKNKEESSYVYDYSVYNSSRRIYFKD